MCSQSPSTPVAARKAAAWWPSASIGAAQFSQVAHKHRLVVHVFTAFVYLLLAVAVPVDPTRSWVYERSQPFEICDEVGPVPGRDPQIAFGELARERLREVPEIGVAIDEYHTWRAAPAQRQQAPHENAAGVRWLIRNVDR
jgi:hypothetical protein